MKLTQTAKQSLDFSQACFLQGMCTAKEFLKAIKSIYTDDVKKQTEQLMEVGFSQHGAIRNIYNLDKGQEVL